jgi:hypothetical protein
MKHIHGKKQCLDVLFPNLMHTGIPVSKLYYSSVSRLGSSKAWAFPHMEAEKFMKDTFFSL